MGPCGGTMRAGAGAEVTQAHTGSHTQNAIADKFIKILCDLSVCGKTVLKADPWPCDRKRGVINQKRS